MEWKEFLKPSWKKVIAAAVIFALSLFAPVLAYQAYVECGPGGSMRCVPYNSQLELVAASQAFFYPSNYQPNIPLIMVSFAFNIAISYLLACALVHLLDKKAKKTGKKEKIDKK